MNNSCLIAKLGRFAKISEQDAHLLVALEADERMFRKDEIVQRRAQPIEYLHVVKSGWLTSYSMLLDGRRQLLRLFFPGDIVDLSEIAMERAQHDIKCLTNAILCPFPKAGLEPVFRTSPRLTALLFSMTVRENAMLLDRIRAIGRFSAFERLCYLLLEINDRLTAAAGTLTDVDGFRLPLTQSEIADLLGLTNVYVSKTMSRLEKEGLIARNSNRITLTQPQRMQAISEFESVPTIDTSWFPVP